MVFYTITSKFISFDALSLATWLEWSNAEGREEVLMTKNQIDYASLLERRRAAIVQEQLTRDRDLRSHALGQAQLAETVRSNLERERQGQASLDEAQRSNQAKEAQNKANLQETMRSNMAKENISLQQLQESNRHSVATENLGYAQLGESQRANMASEALRSQQNLETARSNRAQEIDAERRTNISSRQTDIDRLRLEEAKRNNLMNNQIDIQRQVSDNIRNQIGSANLVTSVLSRLVPVSLGG